jgi:dienelactone hydrolase
MRSEQEIMTAFILASGPFTGGLLWQEVAAPLREAGAEVRVVEFSGLGAEEEEAPDEDPVDLDRHIADVVRAVDATTAPEVVLVGHDYAIHPVLGAAQQRVDRVARIVHLDTGVPQDGDAPLAGVPDPATHALLRERPDAAVPVPGPAEWARWGDTTGLGEADLERLSALSGAQPGLTLTRPLRLTGALTDAPTGRVPISGILCTAAGMTIDAVQQLVRSGMPQFQALADPSVGFLELATGHWPMLSCPEDLAAVLLRAADGEGRSLTPAASRPFHERPFVLHPPEARRVRVGRLDLHLPDGDTPRPAVLLVHGGPLPRDLVPAPRDWPLYTGYAREVANRDVVGAVLEHRLHALTDYPTAAADLAQGIELLRADPRVDPERIALWFFSGAGLLLADPLAAPAPWLRCVAATYPILAPLPGWTGVDPRFDPAAAVPKAGPLPIVLTRVGLESPEITATHAAFLRTAARCGAALEVIDVPNGGHGFDGEAPSDESRTAVRRALDTVVTHLHR